MDRSPTQVEGFDLGGWLDPFRILPIGLGDGDVLAFTDSELTFHVAERDGVFRYETTSRGTQRVGHGSFSDLGGAVRLLMLEIGTAERSGRLPEVDARIASGFTVEEGPTAVHLAWPDGWADLRADRSVARRSRLFSRTIGHDLAELAESLRRVDGRPLFAYTPPPKPDAAIKPLTAEQARAKAELILRDLEVDLQRPLALWEGDVSSPAHEEHGDHWTFVWNSVEYWQTRDAMRMLLVGPIAVPKDGGRYFILPTYSTDLDELIAEHLRRDPGE
jgi:hypothetical protein